MPFVEFVAGTKDPGVIPGSLMNLSHRIESNYMGEAHLSLFDPTFDGIENLLIQFQDNITLRYGWVDGPQSQVLQMRINKYIPTFLATGTQVELYLTSVGITSHQKVYNRTFAGRISDIVRQLLLEDGYTLDEGAIEPTNRVGIYYQCNTTNANFILSILQPQAQSASNAEGYRFNVVGHKAFFRPPGLRAELRQYVFAREHNGVVLSFSPAYDGNAVIFLGGGETRVDGWSTLDKGSLISRKLAAGTRKDGSRSLPGIVINNAIPVPVLQFGDRGVEPAPLGKAIASRAYAVPFDNVEQAEDWALTKWANARSTAWQATASILGDPTILSQDYAEFIVLKDDFTPHYVSGVYRVNSIEHVMTQGSFVSNLTMERSTSKVGTKLDPRVKFQSLGERDETTGSILVKSQMEDLVDAPFTR